MNLYIQALQVSILEGDLGSMAHLKVDFPM